MPLGESKPTLKWKDSAKGSSVAGRGWRALTLLLLLVLIIGVGALAWFGRGFLLQLDALDKAMSQREASVESVQRSIERVSAEQSRLALTVDSELKTLQEGQHRQSMLIEHNSGSQRVANLLDEAQFLVRLANQRLLVERKPGGAQALLASADQVLKAVDDPGLLVLRKTLSENMSALRQAPVIDREGIFLRIATVAEAIMSFRALPEHGLAEAESLAGSSGAVEKEDVVAAEQAWYQRLWQNARAVSRRFVEQHFHVRSLNQPLAPLMSVVQETQLRHRLLIDLGNAQQAVLREEPLIYQSSLNRVEQDLKQYFTSNKETQSIIDELALLRSESVQQDLPDITASLYALQDYREAQRSRFDGVEKESP